MRHWFWKALDTDTKKREKDIVKVHRHNNKKKGKELLLDLTTLI
jgi:hypothetical protein